MLPEPFDTQIPAEYSLGVFLYALLPVPFVPFVYVAVSLAGVPSTAIFGLEGGLRVLLSTGVPALLATALARFTVGRAIAFWVFVGSSVTCLWTAALVRLALRVG